MIFACHMTLKTTWSERCVTLGLETLVEIDTLSVEI